jgi:hypothetical protein
MQDRTSANSMKVLLQRTAGPYIRVKRVTLVRSRRLRNVRFAPKATGLLRGNELPLCAISRHMHCTKFEDSVPSSVQTSTVDDKVMAARTLRATNRSIQLRRVHLEF